MAELIQIEDGNDRLWMDNGCFVNFFWRPLDSKLRPSAEHGQNAWSSLEDRCIGDISLCDHSEGKEDLVTHKST